MMTAKKKSTLCIIVPAYNEGEVIRHVVEGLRDVFNTAPYDFRIIVVDDGSKDNTAEQADQAGAHVIRHVLNSGSGGATATGLSYAYQKGFDIATTSDGDGQHDPADVLRGVEHMLASGHDLLIGSRLINNTGMSRVKILGNRGLSFITYILFGINVTDSQSGLRIFSQHALSKLKWKTSGYEFCSEMLWRAKQLNLKIGEFPIKAIYTDYSRSKGQNNWNAFNIIKSLLKRRVVEFFSE